MENLSKHSNENIEAILSQALTITTLIYELHKSNFLESDFFKNNCFKENNDNNSNFKKILNQNGIGNIATLQMFLYILLVMPKEILKDEQFQNELNEKMKILDFSIKTTYPEENKENVNLYKRIRNAVAHYRCFPTLENNIYSVQFEDVNPNDRKQTCKIKMEISQVELMLVELQKSIMEFLNNKKQAKSL